MKPLLFLWWQIDFNSGIIDYECWGSCVEKYSQAIYEFIMKEYYDQLSWDGKRGLKIPCYTWYLLAFNVLFKTLLSQTESILSDVIFTQTTNIACSFYTCPHHIMSPFPIYKFISLWFQIRIDYYFITPKIIKEGIWKKNKT